MLLVWPTTEKEQKCILHLDIVVSLSLKIETFCSLIIMTKITVHLPMAVFHFCC